MILKNIYISEEIYICGPPVSAVTDCVLWFISNYLFGLLIRDAEVSMLILNPYQCLAVSVLNHLIVFGMLKAF